MMDLDAYTYHVATRTMGWHITLRSDKKQPTTTTLSKVKD